MIVGRIAGSLLGAAAGPFGVAFGFLSGFLVDRVVDHVRVRDSVIRTLTTAAGPAPRWVRSEAGGQNALIRLIGLGIAVAVSDGLVTDAETGAIAGFLRDEYGVSTAKAAQVRRILEEALVLGSRIDVPHVVAGLKLEELHLSSDALVAYLLLVARSRNGMVSDRRRRVVEQICTAAGLAAPTFPRRPLDPFACAVLGIGDDSDLEELRKVYRKLVQQFHPDGAGLLTEEQRRQSNEALVRINHAYDTVLAQLRDEGRNDAAAASKPR